MKSRDYRITLTGETALLLHHDNISWAETMKSWGTDPANRPSSVAGDDRSPAWRWLGNLYHCAGLLTVPADNIMTLLREGGMRCPTGKGQKTFKAQTQSGLMVNESDWNLLIKGKTVPYAPFESLIENSDFQAHEQAAIDHGFVLFVKRAKIGAAKHIRVRPRFNPGWQISGTITVFDDAITTDVLRNILTFAGAYAGLGDWRPSSPKSPGPFGKFTAEVEEIR